ncbi:MAG: PLP-dependent aminotransferase family protein [Candidatus Eisenbacteria bacterium]|uniref:PLP-dependent aminotransferase family protein n=1 Tax=Eiseniibacteriota bacterium TaxID=2212470 RepID=A0A948RV03_UNCEI|nr:PLP-dependent aminotransferase family protein [Candidatus Eisenbacteria bacterium]MBU1949297.1 PLP-dependent aminotransferase family protein [Candidatus Eisenbacteria bacterium]MBU2690073.1 PLP-dependent aminotransferase family protein [Candidatus Eisenbacteria bacterium]
MMLDLQRRLANRARGKEPSIIRELLKYLKIDGMISLGGGYPNPDTFVFKQVDVQFKDGTKAALEGKDLITASQYGPSDAHAGLRRELIDWHRGKDGVTLDESQIVVLNGSQEGLFIMAYLFAEAEDSIVVSEPTYPGALASFKSFTKNFVSVPLDVNGMDTSALASKLSVLSSQGKPMPKFIYTIPNGHNPGGVGLSQDRKKQMLELASKYDLLICEDDPYQLVRLDDNPPGASLQSMDTEGRVVRLDSFSKIFAPGLRIGYASGPADIVKQILYFKQCSNLHTSMFIQALLHQYLTTGGHDGFRVHIRKNCDFYRRNRDAMMAAAHEYLPSEVTYNVPNEGMFIWFVLPKDCNANRMIEEQCESLKVLLVPGGAFSTQGGLQNCMRASFSMVSPEQIHEGMKRFGEMVKVELERS